MPGLPVHHQLPETISGLQSLKYLLSGPSWKKFANLWLKTEAYFGASLVAQTVKNLPAMLETWVQSLGQEDPLEKGMATHSSILAQRIVQTKESSLGSQRIGHDRVTDTFMGSRAPGLSSCALQA